MPGRTPPGQQRSNLQSRRLVYLRSSEVFRFIGRNPNTCVQYVTFKQQPASEEPEQQMPGVSKTKFAQGLARSIEQHNLNTVRTVQYFNCAGYQFGERRTK